MECLTLKNRIKDTGFSISRLVNYDTHKVHMHDCIEIIIITKGSGIQNINGTDYMVKAGDVYIVSKGIAHSIIHSSDMEYYALGFYQELLYLLGSGLEKIPGFSYMFTGSPSDYHGLYIAKMHLQPHDLINCVDKLIIMESEFDNYTAGSDVLCRAELIALVVFLSRKFSDFINKDCDTDSKLKAALGVSYMEKYLSEKITLKNISKHVSLSMRHFSRLFNEMYHTSPIDYLMYLRIQHSLSLLKLSKYSITDIAYKSGFSSSSYYSKQFKKITGITPQKYREINKF